MITFEQYMKHVNIMGRVYYEAVQRAGEATDAIHRSTIRVLGGRRSGRKYKIAGTRRSYTASAPKESPAARTRGKGFRYSWDKKPEFTDPGVETSNPGLARILTKGAKRKRNILRRRPFVRVIRNRSMRSIRRIYRRAYFNG